MNPRDAVRGLAIGRIAIGVGMLLFPRLAGRLSLGADADSAAVSVFTRALGGREVLLGGMLLHTLGNAQVARRWTSAIGVMDAIDMSAAFAARDGLPPSRRAMFYGMAGGSAAAHTALARQLADEPSEAR